MPITYVSGDIFDSNAQTLVNPVNTVGVMGKGLAKAFKVRFPKMFRVYQEKCATGEITIGRLWLFKTDERWILNFPTKDHWRGKSKLEYIEAGLGYFIQTYAEMEITSIAFPKLGCGLGGLDWESEVRPMMERILSTLPIPIEVYIG